MIFNKCCVTEIDKSITWIPQHSQEQDGDIASQVSPSEQCECEVRRRSGVLPQDRPGGAQPLHQEHPGADPRRGRGHRHHA